MAPKVLWKKPPGRLCNREKEKIGSVSAGRNSNGACQESPSDSANSTKEEHVRSWCCCWDRRSSHSESKYGQARNMVPKVLLPKWGNGASQELMCVHLVPCRRIEKQRLGSRMNGRRCTTACGARRDGKPSRCFFAVRDRNAVGENAVKRRRKGKMQETATGEGVAAREGSVSATGRNEIIKAAARVYRARRCFARSLA